MGVTPSHFNPLPQWERKFRVSEMVTKLAFTYSHSLGIYSIFPGRGFNHPIDLTIDDEGTIYVLDRGGSDTPVRLNYKRVSKLTVDEEHRGTFVIGGVVEGAMMWPVAVVVGPDGNLYISDEALHRVHIFSKDGTFSAPGASRAVGPASLTVPRESTSMEMGTWWWPTR